MLEAVGRSPVRTSHLHSMVTAPGQHTLVTHIFVDGYEYLERDSVFGVKESLIKDFQTQPRRHSYPRRSPGRGRVGQVPLRHRPGPRRGGRGPARRGGGGPGQELTRRSTEPARRCAGDQCRAGNG